MVRDRYRTPNGDPYRQAVVSAAPRLGLVVAATATALGMAACGNEAAYQKAEPYELTAIDENINRVILTQQASDRLVMETAPVTEAELDGQQWLSVPYASLIYDTSGGTWVYLRPEPLTYIRTEVFVDYIEGDVVYLSDGPEIGSDVAITSVAELYGADTGVGK